VKDVHGVGVPSQASVQVQPAWEVQSALWAKRTHWVGTPMQVPDPLQVQPITFLQTSARMYPEQ
jgi:hypothetical protein